MFEGVKWLFFDVGSTLVDESAAYACRLRQLARSANLPYEQVYGLAVDFYRQNKKGDLEAARQLGVPLPPWPPEEERPYPDASGCLAALHDRYRIGVIANQPPGTEGRLARYGLLAHMDLVVSSAEAGVSKPDSQIFQLALQRASCPPEQAVMIGDRIDNDIAPARRLGMGTIWIRQGFGRYWTLSFPAERADAVVNSLSELLHIL